MSKQEEYQSLIKILEIDSYVDSITFDALKFN